MVLIPIHFKGGHEFFSSAWARILTLTRGSICSRAQTLTFDSSPCLPGRRPTTGPFALMCRAITARESKPTRARRFIPQTAFNASSNVKPRGLLGLLTFTHSQVAGLQKFYASGGLTLFIRSVSSRAASFSSRPQAIWPGRYRQVGVTNTRWIRSRFDSSRS